MTLNEVIANEIIEAEAEDESLKVWGDIIDNFAFYTTEEMAYSWNLSDDSFDQLVEDVKQAILRQVDLSKVQEIIEQSEQDAIENFNELFQRYRDYGWTK